MGKIEERPRLGVGQRNALNIADIELPKLRGPPEFKKQRKARSGASN